MSIFKKTIKYFILIFFLFTFYLIGKERLVSPSFVDEQDNFVIGKELSLDKKLYRDYFSHHQPLAYIISASIQKTIPINSIFELISRHRQFIFIWSCLWYLFFTYKFGYKGLLISLSIESLKYWNFAYMFLAESIIIYPLIFITLSLFYKKLKILDIFLLGISFAISFWTLATIWPFLFFTFLFLFFKNFKNKKFYINFSLSFILITIIVLFFIDIRSYLQDAIYTNIFYYIPQSTSKNSSFSIYPLISFLTIFFQNNKNPHLYFLQIYSLIFTFSFIYLVFVKKQKIYLLFFIFLSLLNIRKVSPNNIFFSAFHLLPWLVIFITLSLHFFKKTLNYFKHKNCLIFIILILLILTNFIQLSKQDNKKNILQEYDIHYSTVNNIGSALKKIKNEKDTLLVISNQVLYFYQTEITPSSRYIFYYPWMDSVPAIVSDIKNIMNNNPPNFLHYQEGESSFIKNHLSKYNRLSYRDNITDFYILKENTKNLSSSSIDELNFFNIKITP